MKSQISQDRSKNSVKALRNHGKSIDNTKIPVSHQVTLKASSKEFAIHSHIQTRSSNSKALSREMSPSSSTAQRTGSGSKKDCNLGSESLVYSPLISSTSVRNINSNQLPQNAVSKKQMIISLQKDGKNIKIKKEDVASKNLDIKLKKGRESINKSVSPIRSAQDPHKAKISGAIFERDEADEDDTVDSYHHRQQSYTQENQEGQDNLEDIFDQGNVNINNMEAQHILSETSRMLSDGTNMSRGYKFRPVNIVTSELVNLLPKDINVGSAKSPCGIRGAFMNEHITMTELEKQKEKQRQMKEALDFQLNEKKRKIEEEKMREREESMKEEQRIKREIEQLKVQREKEAVLESRKYAKTEDSEPTMMFQSNPVRSPPNRQVERSERVQTEVLISPPTHPESPDKKTQKSPLKATRTLEPLNRENSDIRIKTVESKTQESLYTLADENKKLRDENSKKEELIDALIHALKTKGSNNSQGLQGIPSALSTKPVDVNSRSGSKPVKGVNIFDTESDSYGYYLNGYSQNRTRARAISEQHSGINRHDSREANYTMNDDKNYSIINHDQTDGKNYEPKSASKTRSEFVSDYEKGLLLNHNSGYQALSFIPPLRASDPLTFAGSPANNRVYSSPLTSYMTKSMMSAPSYKPESRSISYISHLNQITNGPILLEPIKTPLSGNLSYSRNPAISTSQNFPSDDNSYVSLRKKYESSLTLNENSFDGKKDGRPTKTYRPIMNIIREDGAFSLAKPSKSSKESTSTPHPSSSPVNGSLLIKRQDIVELLRQNSKDKTAAKVGSFSSNHSNLEPIQEVDTFSGSQYRLLTKLNAFVADSEKKTEELNYQKDRWVLNDSSPLKRPNREELLEKVKALPVLDSKPKFPKEVFSSSLRKRVCP